MKQEKRRAERAWVKNKNANTELSYSLIKLQYYTALNDKRCQHYRNEVSLASGNMGKIFNVVKILSNDNTEPTYPSVPKELLPEKFAKYFKEKITIIRQKISAESNLVTPSECLQMLWEMFAHQNSKILSQ